MSTFEVGTPEDRLRDLRTIQRAKYLKKVRWGIAEKCVSGIRDKSTRREIRGLLRIALDIYEEDRIEIERRFAQEAQVHEELKKEAKL
jgi:hypothetical protein